MRAKAGHVEESNGFRKHGWRVFMHQRRPQFETCTSANSVSKRVDSGFSWAVGGWEGVSAARVLVALDGMLGQLETQLETVLIDSFPC